MSRRTRIILAILNAVFFIITIIANGLATSLPLNGKDPRELSELYPNFFVPAPLTFSIWGIIYLLLFAFIIYQLIEVLRIDRPSGSFSNRISFWFIISCVANASWIVAWHYLYVGLSVAIMLLLLFALLQIYQRLGVGITEVSRLDTYLVHLPFSVYVGWISVATVANITAALVNFDWGAFGLAPHIWAVLMIVTVTGLGIAMLLRRNDPYYVAVLVWAFAGIAVKQSADEAGNQMVFIAAIAAAIVLFLAALYQIIKRKVY